MKANVAPKAPAPAPSKIAAATDVPSFIYTRATKLPMPTPIPKNRTTPIQNFIRLVLTIHFLMMDRDNRQDLRANNRRQRRQRDDRCVGQRRGIACGHFLSE